MGKLKTTPPKPVAGAFPCPVKVTLDFGATPSLCPAFALRLVRGVKNGPSPEWLQQRPDRDRPAADQRAGRHHQLHHLRPRPAAARVRRRQGARQSHRAARAATARALLALDGKTYTLDDTMCVIADENGVESLAGIMGGEAIRLLGDDHRRADRIGAVGAAQHRADRPQARHQLGRALSLRARRRSGLHGAGARARDRSMVLDLCGGTPSEITVAGEAEAAEARHRLSRSTR